MLSPEQVFLVLMTDYRELHLLNQLLMDSSAHHHVPSPLPSLPLSFFVLLKHIPESPTLLSSSIKSDSDFKGIQTIFSLARVLSDNWYWNTKTRRTTITISPVTKPFFSEVYAVKLMLQIVCSSIFPTTGYARTQVCESPEETQCFPGPKQMVRLALSSVIRYLK